MDSPRHHRRLDKAISEPSPLLADLGIRGDLRRRDGGGRPPPRSVVDAHWREKTESRYPADVRHSRPIFRRRWGMDWDSCARRRIYRGSCHAASVPGAIGRKAGDDYASALDTSLLRPDRNPNRSEV